MTDYDFPDEWDSMTTEEKSIWFTQERCRRQAERQSRETEVTKRRAERRRRFRVNKPLK